LTYTFSDVRGGIMEPKSSWLTVDLPHTCTEAFTWIEETGWISWRPSDGACSVRLCWLPLERRGESFSWHGRKVVIGARQGAVTILDFLEVVTMLEGLD
jgi:hypothetical protein